MNFDKSDLTTITLAIILIIICFVIRYAINKRRFKRRGIGGLQHFQNYEHAWIITLVEKTLMILTFITVVASAIFTLMVILF